MFKTKLYPEIPTQEEEKILKKLSAKPGNKGEINCKFVSSENTAEFIVHFIAKRDDNGKFNPGLKFSKAESGTGIHTITGLKSGSKYTVYAYLSNPRYSDEINISKTLTANSFAG